MNPLKSDKEILVEAYTRGHGFNPAYPNLHNLDLDRISKMNGDEQDAKDLVRTLQMSDANYDGLVLSRYGRSPDFDGEIGEATRELVAIPRCPIPDFPLPVGARFDTGIPELNRAIETQSENAMGTGSWPSCDPERPGVNSFRVRIDITRCPASIRSYLDKALQAVVECYAEVGCALRYILAPTGDCEIAKRFEPLAGGVIGWNEFPSPNTCNQTINGRLDTGYAPSDWRYWANLEAHETGHGVGAQHTRGHIMNPSILLVWRDSPKPNISWKGGPSESSMNRWFGGVPVPVVGQPDDPAASHPVIDGSSFAEVKDGNIVLRGKFNLQIKEGQKPGVYPYTFVPVNAGAKEYKLEKAIVL